MGCLLLIFALIAAFQSNWRVAIILILIAVALDLYETR